MAELNETVNTEQQDEPIVVDEINETPTEEETPVENETEETPTEEEAPTEETGGLNTDIKTLKEKGFITVVGGPEVLTKDNLSTYVTQVGVASKLVDQL